MRFRTRHAWLVPTILAAAWIFAWLDPETGIRSWQSLREDLAAAHGRIAELEQGLVALETEAGRLEADPLAIEAAIREDLGLARSGDTVVILRDRADGRVLARP